MTNSTRPAHILTVFWKTLKEETKKRLVEDHEEQKRRLLKGTDHEGNKGGTNGSFNAVVLLRGVQMTQPRIHVQWSQQT